MQVKSCWYLCDEWSVRLHNAELTRFLILNCIKIILVINNNDSDDRYKNYIYNYLYCHYDYYLFNWTLKKIHMNKKEWQRQTFDRYKQIVDQIKKILQMIFFFCHIKKIWQKNWSSKQMTFISYSQFNSLQFSPR